jgi:hypothetical protein
MIFTLIKCYEDWKRNEILNNELEKQKSFRHNFSNIIYCIFPKELLLNLLNNKFCNTENKGIYYRYKLLENNNLLIDLINDNEFIVKLNTDNILNINYNQIKIEYTFNFFKKYPDIGFGIIRNFLNKDIILMYDKLSIIVKEDYNINIDKMTIYDCYIYLLNKEDTKLLDILKSPYKYGSLLTINILNYVDNLIEEIYIKIKENYEILFNILNYDIKNK